MMKKMIHFFISFWVLITSVYANSALVNCQSRLDDKSALSELSKNITSCEMQTGIANLDGVKEEHRKNIYEKLSTKLSLQINQNSEELALLTSFFSANDQDLLMNNNDVKNNCNLANIEKIETCGGKKLGPLHAMKLQMLKNKLRKSNSKNEYGDDLSGIMAEKYMHNLGLTSVANKKASALSCPVEGSSGSFLLQSQIDEISANEIIEDISKSEINSNDKFDKYAQLKLIKDASKDNPAFMDKFKNYLKNRSKWGGASKDYIANFFKDKTNQDILAPSLANQCGNINDNINTFLCSDLDELGSTNETASKDLFTGLDVVGNMDDQFSVDFKDKTVLTAYGFQCIAHAKNQSQDKSSQNASSPTEQRLDDWYADFTKNTRPTEVNGSDKEITKNFCDKFLCKSDDVKDSPSCKSGGPLTSSDMAEFLECNNTPQGKKCDSLVLKSIDYIKNLKIITEKAGSFGNSSSESSSSDPTKIIKAKSSLPDFAENYLGIKKSLIALGVPVTDVAIAEKTQDFKDRKLSVAAPPYSAPGATNSRNNESATVASTNIPYAPIASTDSFAVTPSSFKTSSGYAKTESSNNNYNYNKAKADNTHWTDDVIETTPKDKVNKTAVSVSSSDNSKDSDFNKNFNKEEFDQYKRDVAKELSANRNRIGSISSELARTQSELANQRAEMERRLSDLERRHNEIKGSANPKDIVESSALKKETDSLKSEISNLTRGPAAIKSGGGLIITPDNLKTLSEEELKDQKIDTEKAFVIAIKIKNANGEGEHLEYVPVIRHNSKNGNYLIPKYAGKNEEIIKAIEKSPLFYDFIKIVKNQMKSFTNLKDIIKGR